MATIAEIESMLDYWRGIVLTAKSEKGRKHAAKRVQELLLEVWEAQKVAPAPFPEMNPKQF